MPAVWQGRHPRWVAPRLPLADAAGRFAALPPHWGCADRRIVLLTACQLVWEALWQKRLTSRLWARASPDAPSRGSSRAMTCPFAWSRRPTTSHGRVEGQRRPGACRLRSGAGHGKSAGQRPRLRAVRHVGPGAGLSVLDAAPVRWCWVLTTRTAHIWRICARTAWPTACPSCQLSAPSASTSWNHAPVPRQRARCGAPRPVLSIRLRSPLPHWRTPWQTG